MTQETNDVVGQLRDSADTAESSFPEERDNDVFQRSLALTRQAAYIIQSQSARIAELREGLNAIIDRAPERDVKWAGMTARDIAISLTKDSTSG